MGALQIINEAIKGGKAASTGLKAADRAAAGRAAAELIKSQEQIKASEALGQLMEKGIKRTTTTQADRTRVGGGNIGGAPFSAISEADPNYAGKVWGVMDEGTASRLINLTDPETAWTTMLGSASQLKTNPIVFDKLKRGFIDSMKAGNLSDELAAKINHNLGLTFGEGADIRDPSIWKQANTFDKRAALADLMMGKGIAPKKGGVALGGEKSGKGVIFRPSDILIRETEQSLLHPEHGGEAPTFAAGPRLFRIDKESEFRPDLHPGFPTLLTGKDYNINMKPTPTEAYLPDWHREFKKNNPDRKAPGYYDLALGVKGEGLPSQELNDEYIRHLLREGFAEGGEVHADFHDKLDSMIQAHMADGGGDFDSRLESMIKDHHNTLPDIEPAQEAPIANVTAHKQHMGNQDISRTSVSAGMNLGDMGRVGGGMNMTNVMTGKDAQLMKELMAYYSNNVGNANINANLIKPMGGNNTLMNLMGSMPVGDGRVSMGLHGSNQDGRNQLNARSVGYQTPMGGGHFNANINSPVHGSPSANVNFTKQFADGGDVHMAAGGSSRRKADVTEALTEGLAPMLYGGAKGALASLLGFPGELEQLGRTGINFSFGSGPGHRGIDVGEEPFLPNTKRVSGALPNYRGSKVANEVAEMGTDLGENIVGTMLDPLAVIKGAKPALEALKMLRGSQGTPATRQAQRGVIKMPGGNWLTGNVEKSLEPLKRGVVNEEAARRLMGDAFTDERMANPVNNALNNYVDRNLTNYVKKQMATPDDPVRKLAEEGIVHIPTEIVGMNRYKAPENRRMYGGEQMGKSEAAQAWEDASDVAIYPGTVGEIKRVKELGGPGADKYEPWMEKADPKTIVSRTTGNFNAQDLGFDHIMDVLRQDVREGRIRPEQLNKVSMEQAVRRTYEYDQEMARKMAETQAKVTEGMPVHKDYPDKGYKWLELTAPKPSDVLPEGWTMMEPKAGVMRAVSPEGDRVIGNDMPELIKNLYNRHPDTPGNPRQVLAQALRYEGDTMGHCVGGYCPDVLEGRTRIYSLRDAKGEPHVTVEVQPDNGILGFQQAKENYPELYAEYSADKNKYFNSWREFLKARAPEALENVPKKIVQIKGKGNAAPKEDYLPYVQDFVKSGNWSDVGDLHNTGLRKWNDKYLNKQDIEALSPTEADAFSSRNLNNPLGMKRGGKVNIEQEYKFKKFRK